MEMVAVNRLLIELAIWNLKPLKQIENVVCFVFVKIKDKTEVLEVRY